MSGYCVFQAYDGRAAFELCCTLPEIKLLVLNTEGTGTDTPALVRSIREVVPGLPALHIGRDHPADMPADVPTLSDSFNAQQLLSAVVGLVKPGPAD